MMSQFSAFLLRRRCVAPLSRSRMLCGPAVASRTPVATNARVSTQGTRTRHLMVISIGLLATVLLFLFTSICILFSCFIGVAQCTLHTNSEPDSVFLQEISISVVMTGVLSSSVFSPLMPFPSPRSKPCLSLLTHRLRIGHACHFQSISPRYERNGDSCTLGRIRQSKKLCVLC